MAEIIYEIGLAKTTGAAAGPVGTVVPATIAVGTGPPEIREIGIFNVTGVAAELGIGVPSAAGTGTVGGSTVQALTPWRAAGHTVVTTSFGTLQPTAPANFMRRWELQAVPGAGSIFTWAPGEFVLWAGAAVNQLVIWQISALAVGFDFYVKIAE
jgi:hypothetical protein